MNRPRGMRTRSRIGGKTQGHRNSRRNPGEKTEGRHGHGHPTRCVNYRQGMRFVPVLAFVLTCLVLTALLRLTITDGDNSLDRLGLVDIRCKPPNSALVSENWANQISAGRRLSCQQDVANQ
jgi:hypothetical protein